MLDSCFTLILCTPHFSEIWYPLKLSIYLFCGEFLTKILHKFFCPHHVYIQRSLDPPWFNRCNRVNYQGCAMCFTHLLLTPNVFHPSPAYTQCVAPISCLHPMCFTHLLLTPTQYSPQQFQFFLTYISVLPLDQQTKFPNNIKHAELPFLLNVRLVATWGRRFWELSYTARRNREFSLFTAS
jgi:hypothetical protein